MNQEKITELEKMIREEYGNIAGVVVRKDGKTQYEQYFNRCTADSRLHVYSVTKSVISILIGIAIDKGYIKSIDQNVLEFFPDYAVKDGEDIIQDITIKDMLKMTAPYKYEEEPYIEYFTSGNYVKFALDSLGGREKTGAFRYAALIGPDILSGILVNASGQSVRNFAVEHLFSPLGITVGESIIFKSEEEQFAFNSTTEISGWAADPLGVNTAGWGITLSPADMAKLGQLYLDGGMWNGTQIVSDEWVRESTSKQSRWEELDLPYGYLWWVEEHGFEAMGDGGNVIYVNREKKIVVAIASLMVPDVKDRIEFIKRYLEPIFS